ncbi:hypothetical protein Tcan_07291 [Toxocara canis]|uniref:Uncharacterized protein n=2 Tax=Toxocara canis TaxID=6265 RepID=A0A0B2VYB6_TOXCA|nr:hypothetical protein Tcan_07291 [Toxocara canis]VDM37240.1 unnamed protein product [Toxocara canis]
MPTTLGDEFDYNPFLRTDKQELRSALRDLGYRVPELAGQVQVQESKLGVQKKIMDDNNCLMVEADKRKVSETKSEEGVLQEEMSIAACVNEVVEVEKTTEVIESVETSTGSSNGSKTSESERVEGVKSLGTVKGGAAMERGSKSERVVVETGNSNVGDCCSFHERVAILRLLRAAKDAYVEHKEKLAAEALKANS